MKRFFIALALLPAPAFAQSAVVAGSAPSGGPGRYDTTCVNRAGQVVGCIIPTFAPMTDTDQTSQREAFKLVNANTPTAARTVFGGDYLLSQTCTGYGTVTVQVLGPDGSTYRTVLTKTAADTAGADSGLTLGARAVVQVQVSGTTGCNVVLSRVPS